MEDKEIIENMLDIRQKSKDEENDIKNIKHFKELDIIPQTDKYNGWQEENVYVVEKEAKGENGEQFKLYELYDSNNNLIATTNENGEIIFEEEYLKSLEQIIDEKFKGLVQYEELGLKEKDREIYLEKVLEDREPDLIKTDEELDIEKEELPKQPEEEQFSQEELQKKGNGWEQYTSIIKIKETDPIYNDLPNLEKPIYIGLDKSGKFKALTIGEDGSPSQSAIIEESRSTMEPVIHIDDTGEPVKTMVPTAVMNTNDSDIKVSVKIGQYGYMEAQKLQRAHDNRYIATNIDKVGGYDKEFDVRYKTDETKQGNDFADELADNYENREREDDNNINLHEIDVNIERVKRDIADNALEVYENMSPQELKNYIREQLINTLGEEDSHIDEFEAEIKETVEEEARYPQRGEKS